MAFHGFLPGMQGIKKYPGYTYLPLEVVTAGQPIQYIEQLAPPPAYEAAPSSFYAPPDYDTKWLSEQISAYPSAVEKYKAQYAKARETMAQLAPLGLNLGSGSGPTHAPDDPPADSSSGPGPTIISDDPPVASGKGLGAMLSDPHMDLDPLLRDMTEQSKNTAGGNATAVDDQESSGKGAHSKEQPSDVMDLD